MKNNKSVDTVKCWQRMSLSVEPGRIYTDNSLERTKSFRGTSLDARHFDTSSPSDQRNCGRSSSSSKKHGAAYALVPSGLSEEEWHGATERCYRQRNICDAVADDKTAQQKRNDAPFKGLVIPFGPKVGCIHVVPKYFLNVTSRGWTGWLLVADWDDIQNCESTSDIAIFHHIPCNDGSLKQPGQTHSRSLCNLTIRLPSKSPQEIISLVIPAALSHFNM